MRKRLYTPLQICSPAASAVDDSQQTPSPVIHNIVSTAQIESTKMPMDLQAISEVLPAGSNTTVMVIVPGANAPWSCLSDAKGHVKSTMFTGKDGD